MIKIAIDPGHPSRKGDRGAVYGDFVEADYNLNISRRIVRRINNAEPGIVRAVILRQAHDEVLSFAEREERARGSDLVLSVHVNAHIVSEVSGALSFHWPGNEVAASVGETIMRAFPPPLLRRRPSIPADPDVSPDHRWLEAPAAVIGAYSSPCVLVELGYMTNGRDRRALQHDPTVACIVDAFACGASEYKRQKTVDDIAHRTI